MTMSKAYRRGEPIQNIQSKIAFSISEEFLRRLFVITQPTKSLGFAKNDKRISKFILAI